MSCHVNKTKCKIYDTRRHLQANVNAGQCMYSPNMTVRQLLTQAKAMWIGVLEKRLEH